MSKAWGMQFDTRTNVVDVYVRYLRRKLGDQTIQTVHGGGYRLRTGPELRGKAGVGGDDRACERP